MRINCPYCGPRPNEEFTALGDANKIRPDAETATDQDWQEYVYVRDNPKGRLQEYWHHAGGCRNWLVVDRNTVTHEVYSVVAARDYKKPSAKKGLSK